MLIQVEQVRSWINEINERITEMRLIHSNLLSSPRPDERKLILYTYYYYIYLIIYSVLLTFNC